MPCKYYLPEEEISIANKQLNKLTNLLCKACSMIKPSDIEKHTDLAQWWDNHQKEDYKRARTKLQKALKKQALGKLSVAERKALGI